MFSILSSLLLIFFFLIRKNRNKEKRLWVIFFYVLLSFVFDILHSIFNAQRFKIYFLSLFSITEYSFLSVFFLMVFRDIRFKRLVIFCYPIFLFVAIYSLIYEKKVDFDYLSAPIEAILIIVFSILFFYEQLINPEVTFIYASKSFWIVTACLIYFSATLFLFISTAYLSNDQQKVYWPINDVANIIKNIFFAIAFNRLLINARK